MQTAVTDRLGAGFIAVGDQSRRSAGSSRRPSSSAAAGSRRAPTSGASSCSATASPWARARRSSARSSCNGSQIGPRCTLQDCIVAAGVRIGEGTVVSGGAVLGEGVTVGERNVLTRGVRVFPQTELPDGAITF